MTDEKVYVVTPDVFVELNDKFSYMPKFDYTVYNHKGIYIERTLAEGSDQFLQIIPYVVCKNNDKYLVYKRLKQSGEKRLHGFYSLGIGGHINEDDGRTTPIENGLKREWYEEVAADMKDIKFVGVVKNICSILSDHVGLVFFSHVDKATIKESDKYKEEWMTKQQLYDNILLFEDWAKYIIDQIDLIEKDF